MTGTRRKSRIIALQGLYEIDSVSRRPETVVDRLLSEADFSDDSNEFIRNLVDGVTRNKDDIDNNIQNVQDFLIKKLC